MAIPDNWYSPALPEVTERDWFVWGQTAEIVAPATAAPLWSVTVPVISPVVICAGRETAEARISMRAKEKDVRRRLSIGMPPLLQTVGPLARTNQCGEILFRAGFLSTKFPIIRRMRRGDL